MEGTVGLSLRGQYGSRISNKQGEMAERSKALCSGSTRTSNDSQSRNRRGFESHSHHQFLPVALFFFLCVCLRQGLFHHSCVGYSCIALHSMASVVCPSSLLGIRPSAKVTKF